MCSFPPHGYIALVPLERLGILETLAYLGKTTTKQFLWEEVTTPNLS